MAVVVTLGVSTPLTTNVSSYTSGSFTPAAGDWLVAFVYATATVAVPTMTDSQGLGFDLLGSRTESGGTNTMHVFAARAFAANSAMTVTFDCTGDAATGCVIYVARVTGQEGRYWRQLSSASSQNLGGTDTPAVAMSQAFNSANCGIAGLGFSLNPAAATPPTNWTETDGTDTGYNNPTTGFESCNRESGETGSTITWGAAVATAWTAMVLEVYAAGQGPESVDCPGMFGVVGAV